MHLTGAMDDQTWGYYQDIVYDKLDPYYEKPNVFKPIGDWLSYGAGSIYMMATGQDQQTIHNFQQIAEGEVSTHLRESAESIVMLKDSFATAFNPRNMYNFYINPETSQEEMNKLAADGLTVGLMLAPAVKGLSGMKISAKSTPAYVINGNGTLAVSNSYSLAISTEGVVVSPAYYAAAAVGAVGGGSGGGTASGGDLSGSETHGVENPVEVVGRGSTGRTIPNTLEEQMAMHQVMSNPLDGAVDLSQLAKNPVIMTDPRWPASEGWVKMSNNANGMEIHFVYNKITGAFDDFKFK